MENWRKLLEEKSKPQLSSGVGCVCVGGGGGKVIND